MTITVNFGMLGTIVDDASEGWDDNPITYALDVDPGNLFSDFLEELPFTFDPDITNTAGADLIQFTEIAELWDDLIASSIDFKSGDDHADIIINKVSNLPATSAGIAVSTLHVPLIPDDADVFLRDATVMAGTGTWRTAVHEFGHALGLQHPGDYNAGDEQPQYGTDNEFDVDTAQFSIMSYFDPANFGPGWTSANTWTRGMMLTPMIYDILAIQQHYGVDTSTRLGDTTYGFGSTADRSVYLFTAAQRPVLTIWDAGGAHDVLNVSGFNGSPTQLIDLNEGSYSDIAGLHNNLGIAFDTVIEDAVGGTGIDVIRGNSSANRLDGGSGSGADDIDGAGGNDILIGGDGADKLLGGTEDDDITGGTGGDIISGGEGFDRAFYTVATGETVILTPGGSPSLGQWTVAGSAESTGDTLFGIEAFVFGEGGDTVSLGASIGIYEVTIDGRGGSDTLDLSQAVGKITIAFDSTTATLFDGKITGGQMTAFPGSDTFTSVERFIASDFSDTFKGGKQGNTCFGGDGADKLFGNGGTDTLSGQDGRDRIVGGIGNDRCSGGADADRFVFQTAAEGGDIIADFATGEDIFEIDRSGFGLTARYDLVFQEAATVKGSKPVFLYNAATDELSFDANGTAAGGRTLLAHLTTGVVAAGDILLV